MCSAHVINPGCTSRTPLHQPSNMECPVELVEAAVEEDNGYFFQRLGEVRFTAELAAKRAQSHCIAVAARHGVTAFADATGREWRSCM